MQSGAGRGAGNKLRWVRALRWVLVAGGVAIAIVLLLRRDYVLGVLIAATAVLRLGMLLGTARRRRHRRGGVPDASGVPASGGFVVGLARSEFLVAAGVIGMDRAQVRQSFHQGRSLAEMAADVGVPLDRVLGAIVSDAAAKVDDAVARGTIPERRGLRLKSRLPILANRLVNSAGGTSERYQKSTL